MVSCLSRHRFLIVARLRRLIGEAKCEIPMNGEKVFSSNFALVKRETKNIKQKENKSFLALFNRKILSSRVPLAIIMRVEIFLLLLPIFFLPLGENFIIFYVIFLLVFPRLFSFHAVSKNIQKAGIYFWIHEIKEEKLHKQGGGAAIFLLAQSEFREAARGGARERERDG